MHIKCFSALLSLFILKTMPAQQVHISPVPHNINWGTAAFKNTASFKIIGAGSADKDAVALLKSHIEINAQGIPIHIGERDDKQVQKVKSKIPQKREGYYVSIKPGEVIIAGNDESGTYYGVQSFLQIIKSKQVLSVEITDFPDVSERGVVEGFYGNPFSHEHRLRQFEFYGKNKMNVYIYGPKDDPYHGFSKKWRDFYPAKDAQRIRALVQAAHKNKVKFVWAIHPGTDIHWNYADSIATIKKFEKMYELGIRSFAVFFDDISGVGIDANKQAGYLSYIADAFVKKKMDVDPLIFCPTQYNQSWTKGDYLDILGEKLYPETRIMWTGKSVVKMIDHETMDWINERIKRKAYIWLNYPVNDYMVENLLLGPLYGNEKGIANKMSGMVSNPMEYAEASKIALYSVADYTWNMKDYDSLTSWQNAIHSLMPENEEAFQIFASHNMDLSPNGHNFRRDNESADFKKIANEFLASYTSKNKKAQLVQQLSSQFQTFRSSAQELSNSKYNIPLREEIKPWLSVFDIIGQKGLTLISMNDALEKNDSAGFIRQYLHYDSLSQAQKEVRSRGFEGSIKSPNPKPASAVVEPFLLQWKSLMIKDYKKSFAYRTDVFPAILLADGRYYIKYKNSYLSNTNANATGGQPVFLAFKDSINPQRQEWNISFEPSTERYKIVNAQDNRYLNELGNFGSRDYSPHWNTYLLNKKDNQFSIQNASRGGKGFWSVTNDKIDISNENNDYFIYEIIPIKN